jgi:hypothetical protein
VRIISPDCTTGTAAGVFTFYAQPVGRHGFLVRPPGTSAASVEFQFLSPCSRAASFNCLVFVIVVLLTFRPGTSAAISASGTCHRVLILVLATECSVPHPLPSHLLAVQSHIRAVAGSMAEMRFFYFLLHCLFVFQESKAALSSRIITCVRWYYCFNVLFSSAVHLQVRVVSGLMMGSITGS